MHARAAVRVYQLRTVTLKVGCTHGISTVQYRLYIVEFILWCMTYILEHGHEFIQPQQQCR